MVGPSALAVHEDGELGGDGPVDAVPGDARWDVFAGAPRGWLGHANVDKPAYPVSACDRVP